MRRKRKKHSFIKTLVCLLLLGVLAVGLYTYFYPDSRLGQAVSRTVEKTTDKAREAKPVIKDLAEGVKKTVDEKIKSSDKKSGTGSLASADDLNLRRNGSAYDYLFTYNGEDYRAVYITDTWKIYDSYKITNKHDMKIICQTLSDIYPVPSRDGTSVRTADDMAYEWDQHNKIYMIAPEGSRTKERTRNVDLDPEDQGKSYKDLYQENLG